MKFTFNDVIDLHFNSITLDALDTDGLIAFNMTNLAVKGILGIHTIAEIKNLTGSASLLKGRDSCQTTNNFEVV